MMAGLMFASLLIASYGKGVWLKFPTPAGRQLVEISDGFYNKSCMAAAARAFFGQNCWSSLIPHISFFDFGIPLNMGYMMGHCPSQALSAGGL